MSFDELRDALTREDVLTVADQIFRIYQANSENFMQSILLSDCLPEPLQHDFEKKISALSTFYDACKLVEEKLDAEDKPQGQAFRIQYLPLYKCITDLYTLNKSNTRELTSSELFEYPIPNIVYMTSVFLENQDRLAGIEILKKKEDFQYDFFSTSVSDIAGHNGITSMDSNLETGIETANLVLSYLFFKGRRELEIDIGVIDDVSPYEIESLEKLHVLGVHRGVVNYLWEQIKYRNWNFSHHPEEQDFFVYESPSREFFKLERVAVERYNYINSINIYKRDQVIRTYMNEMAPLIEELSHSVQLDNAYSLFDLPDIKLRKLVRIFRMFNKVAIESLEFLDERIWVRNVLGKDRDIQFEELFLFVSYLQALAMVYSEKSHQDFDDMDRLRYKYLTPRLKKSSLITHFSKLLEVEEKKVAELLYLLTFKPKSRRDEFSDLFLQPMIHFGNREVLLIPALLKRFNFPRLIEEFFSYYNVEDANKGHYFERMTRRILATCPYLKVNTEDLVIDAFDGRDAEFDFFAIFNNKVFYKVLLIEMKCLRRPYSPKEIFQREHEVYYGVDQVNRRAEVVLRDWDKIRTKSNIKGLPSRPPKPEDIIKVVCLNILDFTGKQKDGVFITDFSSITKYFTNPIVKANLFDLQSGSTETVKEYSLWSRNYPYPTEFEEFLTMPHTVRDYYDALEIEGRRVYLIEEGDPNLGFLDYVMIRNPQELMMRHFKNS